MSPFCNVEIGGIPVDFKNKIRVSSVLNIQNKDTPQFLTLEHLEDGGKITEYTYYPPKDSEPIIDTVIISKRENINLQKYELRAATK